MSNYPANRPGHPIHGFNRRFPRSAKARRQGQILFNTFRNQMQKQMNEIRWAEGVKPSEQEAA